MLQIRCDTSDVFAIGRSVIDLALTFSWRSRCLTQSGIALDGVGKVEVSFCVEHEVIRGAKRHAVTRSVNSLDSPVLVDPFDPSGFIIESRADWYTVMPVEAAIVRDVERPIGTECGTVRSAAGPSEHGHGAIRSNFPYLSTANFGDIQGAVTVPHRTFRKF